MANLAILYLDRQDGTANLESTNHWKEIRSYPTIANNNKFRDAMESFLGKPPKKQTLILKNIVYRLYYR
jgi:hypothetical protein